MTADKISNSTHALLGEPVSLTGDIDRSRVKSLELRAPLKKRSLSVTLNCLHILRDIRDLVDSSLHKWAPSCACFVWLVTAADSSGEQWPR